MAFLPYYVESMFPTLLSILPSTLPPALKFLHPYAQALQNPPRHVIVHAASSNVVFFTAFSVHVLKLCRLGFQYPTLLSLWASVAVEATASMLNRARSSGPEAQNQRQGDVITRIMPILCDGLLIRKVPELRVACYMVMISLSAKVNQGEEIILEMMDATVLCWEESSLAGLVCLAVIAQKRAVAKLPKTVFSALLNLSHLEDDLKTVKRQYNAENLLLSFALNLANAQGSEPAEKVAELLFSILEGGLLSNSSTIKVIESMMTHIFDTLHNQTTTDNRQAQTSANLSRLLASRSLVVIARALLQDITSKHKLPHETQEFIRQELQAPVIADQPTRWVDEDEANKSPSIHVSLLQESIATAVGRLRLQPLRKLSFLQVSESAGFTDLANGFVVVSGSPLDLKTFIDLPVLGASEAMKTPSFMSFFVRFWCSDRPAHARATALDVVCHEMEEHGLVTDVQVLLPYILCALADDAPQVRQSAVKFVLFLAKSYRSCQDTSSGLDYKLTFGETHGHGQKAGLMALAWLSFADVAEFLNDVLRPSLEECLLDAQHLIHTLIATLTGGSQNDKSKLTRVLKSALRHALYEFLCSHISQTPLHIVRLRLLPALNRVESIGSLTRMKALLPLYIRCTEVNEASFREKCREEHIDPAQLMKELVGIPSMADQQGVIAIQKAINPGMRALAPLRNTAAAQRIRATWSKMEVDSQLSVAKTLLHLSTLEACSESSKSEQETAAGILRSINLSSPILQSFLENIHELTTKTEDQQLLAKRRKISRNQTQILALPSPTVGQELRRITFVLELIASCKSGLSPKLLKMLFGLLADLTVYGNHAGSDLGYLEAMILESISEIISKISVSIEILPNFAVWMLISIANTQV